MADEWETREREDRTIKVPCTTQSTFPQVAPLTPDLVLAYENSGLYWENELLTWEA